ncbi:MAG: transglutaminase domain-containing protein [Candidatus Heimdallarchaeota archaeon]|nr:transglutaminase domain-containing protein [Candidatus Heimdallarchaeota archaeon]
MICISPSQSLVDDWSAIKQTSLDESEYLVEASNYDEKSSVTVLITLTYKVKSLSPNENQVKIWMQRIEGHNPETQNAVAPMQESQIVSLDFSNQDVIHIVDKDNNQNEIEHLAVNLTENQVFEHTITYRLKLSKMKWEIDKEMTEDLDGTFLSSYEKAGIDTNSDWFNYLTRSELNLEANNSELIELTHEITSDHSKLQDKIEAILIWLDENIEAVSTDYSQGAYLTYLKEQGDCSDYTTLFTTMLRILNVPARTVSGIQLLDENMEFYPLQKGQTFEYFGEKYGSFARRALFPGHAWTEYYHPEYGFITLDPTLARYNPSKYMNYVGYHYFVVSIGESFYKNVVPELPEVLTGWNLIPHIIANDMTAIRWNFTMQGTVEDINGYIWIPPELKNILPVIPIITAIPFILININRKRKRIKQKN